MPSPFSGQLFLFMLSLYQNGADGEQKRRHPGKGNSDPRRRVHEKRLRHNIDQKVGPGIQYPQVVVKENMVENHEIFREVCGYERGQPGGDEEKQTHDDSSTSSGMKLTAEGVK